MDVEKSLQVTRSHNKFFVWNPVDIMTIRKQYRMPATVIGGNDGPPLLLTKHEIRLLLELDAVTICEVSDRSNQPVVAAATERFTDHQKEAFEVYSRLRYEEKRIHIRENESAILSKYRQRNDVGPVTDEEIIKEKESLIEPLAMACMPVQLFTESPFHEFKTPLNLKASDIPMSRSEEVKYQAFKHLWRNGYFLTQGTKFACDFLVYENDPAVCHAKYMLFCRETEDEISAMEILLKGRLSVQVSKEPLFAVVHLSPAHTPSNDSVRITFMKLVWEGKHSTLSGVKTL